MKAQDDSHNYGITSHLHEVFPVHMQATKRLQYPLVTMYFFASIWSVTENTLPIVVS